jgi:NarL family two-component system response regulator LiaR
MVIFGNIMIRVLIVDDMESFRDRFRAVLESEPGVKVVGVAESGAEALRISLKERPDVVLMDVMMETDRAGIDSAKRITSVLPNVKIVMSTVLEDDETIYNAFQIGAVDYLLKNARPEEVISAVKAAYSDQSVPSPLVSRKLRKEFAKLRDCQGSACIALEVIRELTQVELDILMLLTEGRTRNEIAALRCVEVSTMKTHVRNILKKMDKPSSKDLVRYLRDSKVLDLLRLTLAG